MNRPYQPTRCQPPKRLTRAGREIARALWLADHGCLAFSSRPASVISAELVPQLRLNLSPFEIAFGATSFIEAMPWHHREMLLWRAGGPVPLGVSVP